LTLRSTLILGEKEAGFYGKRANSQSFSNGMRRGDPQGVARRPRSRQNGG
jgi:hypothetical protein